MIKSFGQTDEQFIQASLEDVDKRLRALEGDRNPFHFHNGIDSPNIPIKSITGTHSGFLAYNPGSLADGAGETTGAITVKGASLGDWVIVSFDKDLQGITLTGWVSAADTVKARFQNESTAVVDLASGTLYALVIKHT